MVAVPCLLKSLPAFAIESLRSGSWHHAPAAAGTADARTQTAGTRPARAALCQDCLSTQPPPLDTSRGVAILEAQGLLEDDTDPQDGVIGSTTAHGRRYCESGSGRCYEFRTRAATPALRTAATASEDKVGAGWPPYFLPWVR